MWRSNRLCNCHVSLNDLSTLHITKCSCWHDSYEVQAKETIWASEEKSRVNPFHHHAGILSSSVNIQSIILTGVHPESTESYSSFIFVQEQKHACNLSVKNTTRVGSKTYTKNKQARGSWVSPNVRLCAAVRLMCTKDKTQLPHFAAAVSVVTKGIEHGAPSQCPQSHTSFQEVPIRTNSGIHPACPPLPDNVFLREKKRFLFLSTATVRESDRTSKPPTLTCARLDIHTQQTHTHTGHQHWGGADWCTVCWCSTFSDGSLCSL